MPRTKESGTSFEEQHEKNMRILKLIRDDHGWALSRILLAEQLETERDALCNLLEEWRAPGDASDGLKRRTDRALERHP